MKMRNRLISAIMAVIACVSFASVSVFADGPAVALTPSATEVAAGDTITVDVNLSGNPGITSYYASLVATPGLTLTGVADGGLLTGPQLDSDYAKSPYFLYWTNPTATANDTDNGKVVTLTYKVADDAVAGDYTVTVTSEPSNTNNLDWDEFDFGTATATITVKAAEAELPTANIAKADDALIEATKDDSNRVTVAALGTINVTADTKPVTKATVTVSAENGKKAKSYEHTFTLPTNVLSGGVKVAINVRNVPYAEKDNVTFAIAVAE